MKSEYSNIFNVNEVTIIKNFFTKEECQFLNKWTLTNMDMEWFRKGKGADNRRTTRYSNSIEFLYPNIVTKKFNQFRKDFNVDNLKLIEQGRDGIINALSHEGSELELHTDPSYGDYQSFHITVQTSKAEKGGDLIADGVVYNVDEGDAVCFFASAVKHCTNKTEGNKPRIIWIMGIQYPTKKRNLL
jgi:hypothetical protein